MYTKRIALSLILRIIFLLGNMVLISIVIRKPVENQMIFTLISLFLIIVFQVIMLFEFLNRTNQNLLRFFMIIFDSDYSTHFQEKVQSSPFLELNKAFNKVIDKYKDLSRDKELHYYYLDEVVKYIKVGIISVNNSGDVAIMNKPALEMLQVVRCNSWDEMMEVRPDFTQQVDNLRKRGPSILKLDLPYGRRNLSVHVSRLKLQDEPYRLITLQDVQQEVEQGEIEATHKLIRTLTHEIMNSITPISSLTETITMILEKDDGSQKESSELTEMNVSDIRESMESIRERTEGLDHFLQEYRKLSQLPKLPELDKIKITDFFKRILRLMQGEFQKNKISFEHRVINNDLVLTADSHLMEQVLINLIQNSIDATQGGKDPSISLSADLDGDHPVIKVTDNGRGISSDGLDQIFVPFYSTKSKGSGIGLSFSRQIMQLHGGSISVTSIPGEETVFTLQF